MKTYVLTISRYFPTTHKRKGDKTFFVEKIEKSLRLKYDNVLMDLLKIHTIRSNYNFWARRIKQIQKGEAILSIRYWSGKPYDSKQVEICQLDKNSGIGVQKLEWWNTSSCFVAYTELPDEDCGTQEFYTELNTSELAKNDGLSLEDFKEWFKKYDLSKHLAIIHFTSFRY